MSAWLEKDVNVLRKDRKRSIGPRGLRVISESIRVKIPSHLERYEKVVGGVPGAAQQWFFQLFFMQRCALARAAETAHYFKSDQKCVGLLHWIVAQCVSCMDCFCQFCNFDCCVGFLHWIAAQEK